MTRVSSGLCRSTSIRPSSASFAISHSTMAEMLQVRDCSNSCSRGFSLPASAWSRMCVSRFSIPADAGREDVALDLELALEAADQARRVAAERDQFGHRTPVLRDDDAVRAHAIEQREALLLETGRGDGLHHGSALCHWTEKMSSHPRARPVALQGESVLGACGPEHLRQQLG